MPDIGLYPINGVSAATKRPRDWDPPVSQVGSLWDSPAGDFKIGPTDKSSPLYLPNGWVSSSLTSGDYIDMRRGQLNLCVTGVAGAGVSRSISLKRDFPVQIGQTLIACVEMYAASDLETDVGISFNVSSSSDNTGVRLTTSGTGTSVQIALEQFKFLSGVFTSQIKHSIIIVGRAYWLGIKYVGSNSFQAYFSSNGETWVPIGAAQTSAITPTVLSLSSQTNGATAGPSIGVFNFVDLVTTI